MIRSFGDRKTDDFFNGRRSSHARRIPSELRAAALRKLDMVNAAQGIEDLRVPPAKRLEALRGELRGFHSIRINQQWRVIFRWHEGAAESVQIIDYHR